MTPPPEPRTEAWPDYDLATSEGRYLHGTLHGRNGSRCPMLDDRTCKDQRTIQRIEAEAAGAPLREALEKLPRRVAERVESQNRNPASGWRVMAALKEEVAAALAATPAPDHDCLMPSACGVTGFYCANSRPAPAPLDTVTGDALADFINREEAQWRALKPNMSRERWLAARLTAQAAATEDTDDATR